MLAIVLGWQVMLKLGKLYSEMIFQRGFVHCDPHPGNILIRCCEGKKKDLEIILLDHGLYSVSNLPSLPTHSTLPPHLTSPHSSHPPSPLIPPSLPTSPHSFHPPSPPHPTHSTLPPHLTPLIPPSLPTSPHSFHPPSPPLPTHSTLPPPPSPLIPPSLPTSSHSFHPPSTPSLQELSDDFRMNYCRLWQALISDDQKAIRRSCEELQAGSLYRLLACMVTARAWANIESGITNSNRSHREVRGKGGREVRGVRKGKGGR